MADNNKMLIDATHPEETRVVVLRGGRVEEFDYESAARKQLRGNIYLAKVTRVEPSLQAAFVDYGGNRHGFLAFNEIHPDYYQIPVADRQALLEEEAAAEAAEEAAAEARAEAKARRDAARAAAKAARKKDAKSGGKDGDDDDDDEIDAEDDDDITVEHDDDDEIGDETDGDGDEDVIVELSGADTGGDDHDQDDLGAGDDAGNGREATASDESETSGAATRTMSDDTGLAREPRVQSELIASGEDIETPQGASDVSDAQGSNIDHDGSAGVATAVTSSLDAPPASDTGCADLNDPAEVSADELNRDAPKARGLVEDVGVYETEPDHDDQNSAKEKAHAPEAEPINADSEEPVDEVGSEDALEELPSRPRRRPRSYKIQEVIKRRQVVLIQVVKEERGNKGAALTTYLSLAGRYTVLMPNTARGGGISRKITQPQDRKRLKAIAAELDVPEGMGLIIRTAGAARTKQEIKRDFEYLLRLWESVRELTLQSTAPSLVYEEGNLIKRSIRDLYNKDIEEVIVAGDEAYRDAKDFMRMLMPSHAKNVINYKQPDPLFTRFQIERQLNAMFSPYVTLKSGGYLVINQTEALVAIDVNSGKATREFSIEETALVTNIEAAEEIARQLKLRDLAGLIVIDFIDMEEKRNNRNVERRLKEALKHDRARIQVGRISHFGLLEMSRQRLRTGVLEGSTSQCPHCQGTGIIRSVESVALAVLRGLEDAVMAGSRTSLTAVTTPSVALYILNKKRAFINEMEDRHGLPISVEGSEKMQGANFAIERGPAPPRQQHRRPERTAVNMDWGFDDDETVVQEEAEADEVVAIEAPSEDAPERSESDGDGRRRSRRRRRRGRRGGREDNLNEAGADASDDHAVGEDMASEPESDQDGTDDESEQTRSEGGDGEGNNGQRRRRRRGRRGGRRNRERLAHSENAGQSEGDSDDDGDGDSDASGHSPASDTDEKAAMTADNDDALDPAKQPQENKTTSYDSGTDADLETSGAANIAQATPEPAASSGRGRTMGDDEARVAKPARGSDAIPADDQEAIGSTETQRDSETLAATQQTEPAAETAAPRTPRGELPAAAPKVERVIVSTGVDGDESDEADSADTPARKGWWQRRFGQ